MTRGQRFANAASGNATPITNAVIIAAVIITSAWLTWADKVSGDAYIGLVGIIVGSVATTRGVAAGSKASTDPPPSG